MSLDPALEFLRHLPLLVDLSEDDLQALYQQARPMNLPVGDWLMREGEAGDALYVILEGEVEISKRSSGQEVVVAVRGPGDVIGEMVLLEQVPRTASGHITKQARLLAIDREAFQHVLGSSPTAALALLRTVAMRLESTESMLRQREKLASLGTMAAGLAHELNNPAAAVQRSSSQLLKAFEKWNQLEGELTALATGSREAEILRGLGEDIRRRAHNRNVPDLLTASDQEARLQEWLEALEIPEAWELTIPLMTCGFDVPGLKSLTTGMSGNRPSLVIRSIALRCQLYTLMDELHMGAERISEIVRSVRSYTYLDQAPVQEIDLHKGLEDTLVILRHKLKGVSVVREYAPDLPRVEAFCSELNQVWTNLIDNAVDTLGGHGRILLKTYRMGETAVVEVTDDGPGIPDEVHSRIFDPFFTTKQPGSGLGLGLHLVHQIVVDRHRGSISVASKPGATTFKVILPLSQSTR